MDKIFMALMASQAILDTIFNSYQRSNLKMNDEDMLFFIEFLESSITRILFHIENLPEPAVQNA